MHEEKNNIPRNQGFKQEICGALCRRLEEKKGQLLISLASQLVKKEARYLKEFLESCEEARFS